MTLFKSKSILSLCIVLGFGCAGGALIGQVVSPEDRANLLVRMQEVLDHPGERANLPEKPVQDFFFPSYLLEMGPTPREVLQRFLEDLEVAMIVQRQEGPVVRFTKSPKLVKQGDEISFSLDDETYPILVENIQSNPETVDFTFNLNEVVLSITLAR
ncbi:MAG: hypothetical protein JJT75_09425 [Opitutales bacterium]|nr:hypothetical protein [Opitutales bacterium]MCH8539904.1 hypothetical protein [Opitutales bacterium]